MARIRQVPLSPDLFGDKARGVSVPEITWETYAEVVRLSTQKYGPSLKRITRTILADVIKKRNEIFQRHASLVAKKSLMMTLIVTEVHDMDVTVRMSFDDIEMRVDYLNAVLGEVIARARCLELAISDGALLGIVRLPAKVFVFPQKKTGSRQKSWPNASSDVHSEEQFLKQSEVHLIR